MKTRLLQLTLCCAALLPVAQLHASGAAPKTFGGFAPGKTFSLKVTGVDSTKSKDGDTFDAAVPENIPKFTKGEKVKFTIGDKGQLKGPGFAIRFGRGGEFQNNYSNPGENGKPDPEAATVFKDSNVQPAKATLRFYRSKTVDGKPVTRQVTYRLK